MIGPLGSFGRKLGFRWVFFFTFPIPYHPLLFPALLVALLGWTVWSAVRAVAGLGGGNASWAAMLAIALAMAIPLSVPVVAWVMMVFRAPLLQGLLFTLSMALLGIEVAMGRAATPWAILPAAYFGLFVVQALLGPVWLSHLRRENAAFVPLLPGQRPVALVDYSWAAKDLISQCALARVHAPALCGTIKPKTYHWLTPSDAAALRGAMPEAGMPGWSFTDGHDHVLLVREKTRRPSGAILVSIGKHRAPLWLVTGLQKLEARGPGIHHRVTFGTPAVVTWLPLFILFHWTALVGKSEWVIGFPRRTHSELMRPGDEDARSVLTLFAPRSEEGGPFDTDLGEVYADIAAHKAKLAKRRAKEIRRLPKFWDAIANQKRTPRLPASVLLLLDEPDLLDADKVRVVLDWLERARDAPNMEGVHAAARLLAAFPDAALVPHAARIGRIYNSFKLALQWDLARVEDRKVLPKDAPLFAGSIVGFGLYLLQPDFYRRLTTLCPDLKNVERVIGREMESQPGIRYNLAVVFSGGFATARKQTPPPSP